jgi:hypothetical protein
VFANADAAETWFEENDPEGVAFEYEFWRELDRAPNDPCHAVDRGLGDLVEFAASIICQKRFKARLRDDGERVFVL